MASACSLSQTPLGLSSDLPSFSSVPPRLPCSQRFGKARTVSSSADDFPTLENGPSEPILPKFNRLPFQSSLPNSPSIPAAPTDSSATKRKRGRRLFVKPTPGQAIAGSIIAGLCTVGVTKAAWGAYEQIQSHPLAHDLPLNLTDEVNQLVLAALTGFGGLAASMFGVSSVGLALLSAQLISEAKSAPQKPNT